MSAVPGDVLTDDAPQQPRIVRLLITTAAGTFTASMCVPASERTFQPMPVCLLLHGFPDLPEPSFADLAPRLCARGYRVVILHLRGYESATVQGTSTRTGYTGVDVGADLLAVLTQLIELNYVHPATGVVLVGHDWGSIVAQCAVAQLYEAHYDEAQGNATGVVRSRLPKSVIKGVVLIAVPPVQNFLLAAFWLFPMQILYSWYIFFFQLPWLPERQLRKGSLIHRLWRKWSPGIEPAEAAHRAAAVRDHLCHSGRPEGVSGPASNALTTDAFVSSSRASKASRGDSVVAALGYYRCMLNVFHAKSRYSLYVLLSNRVEFLAARAVPTLAINGGADGCIHPAVFKHCANTVRHLHGEGVKHLEVPNVGHWPHIERPDVVADAIHDFIVKSILARQRPTPAPAPSGQVTA